MSSLPQPPCVRCRVCRARLTITNHPMQSMTCGHSICRECFDSKIVTGSPTPKAVACLVCNEPEAFHPKRSKPNFLALAAIDMIDDYAELLRTKIVKEVESEVDAPEARMPTTISTKQRALTFEEQTDKKNDSSPPEDETSPQVSKAVSHDRTEINSRDSVSSIDESASSEEDVEEQTPTEPNSPPTKMEGGRMVWVKFGKVNQLAHLISTKGDVAKIRWESFRYEEEVSVDRIEEMDCDSSLDRKRTRRASTEKPTERYAPPDPKSSKEKSKRRKVSL